MKQLSTKLKSEVLARIQVLKNIAETHYGRDLPEIKVLYKYRGTTAGTAHLSKNMITLQAVLFMENVDETLNETVGHEYAHMVDYWINGVNFYYKGNRRCQDQHGDNWKFVMRLFGQDATRTHNMNVDSVRVRKGVKYIWTCGCPEHIEMEIGQKRHDRKLADPSRGVYTRRHKNCGYTHTHVIKKGVKTKVADAPVNTLGAIAAKTMTTNAFNIPAPKPTPRPKRKTGGKSKLELCREIFSENPYLTRFALITLFVENASCTKAGGATYYAKIKNERTAAGWA